MAPMGVVSVSPVARQATSERKKVITTARMLIQGATLKAKCMMAMTPRAAMDVPIQNQLWGTSIRARGSSSTAPSADLAGLRARTMVFHCRAKAMRPEVTISEAPSQRLQPVMPR
ncbi:hypothetical protein D3C87_1094270 [compost metagenome]